MSLVTFALLFVVFLDIIGQGLVLPLFNTLLMDPSQGFLPADMPGEQRELAFGVVMGSSSCRGFWAPPTSRS